MSELRSFGLKSLKIGDIPSDGAMGTVLAPVGLTYKDTASFKEADANTADQFAEEVDYAIESFDEMGQTLLAWSTMDYTPEVVAVLKGGTVIGVAPNTQWQAPAGVVNIEKCIQIITKRDILFELPRTKLRSVFNVDLKKQGMALLDNKATILQPTAPGVSPINFCKYLPPVVNAGNAQSLATPTANLVGTSVPFRGTNAKILWSVTSKPDGATPGITTPAALSTAITGMTVAGDYVFKLAVTDSNDYTSVATVTITKTA